MCYMVILHYQLCGGYQNGHDRGPPRKHCDDPLCRPQITKVPGACPQCVRLAMRDDSDYGGSGYMDGLEVVGGDRGRDLLPRRYFDRRSPSYERMERIPSDSSGTSGMGRRKRVRFEEPARRVFGVTDFEGGRPGRGDIVGSRAMERISPRVVERPGPRLERGGPRFDRDYDPSRRYLSEMETTRTAISSPPPSSLGPNARLEPAYGGYGFQRPIPSRGSYYGGYGYNGLYWPGPVEPEQHRRRPSFPDIRRPPSPEVIVRDVTIERRFANQNSGERHYSREQKSETIIRPVLEPEPMITRSRSLREVEGWRSRRHRRSSFGR